MHSRLFQIGTSPIIEEDFIDADSYVFDPEELQVDYFEDIEELGDTIEEAYERLAASLPSGMFSFDKESKTITYEKYPEEFFKKFIDKVHDYAACLNPQMFNKGENGNSLYVLRSTVRNYGGDNRVSIDGDFPESMLDFVINVTSCYDIGQKFYLGGVIGFRW